MTNVLGCDISLWQDSNSTPQMFDPAKAYQAGARFVYVKASEGLFLDPDYIMNWRNCRNKLYRGAYHFYRWNAYALDQARFFAGVLNADAGELPPVVDYESRVGVPGRQEAIDRLGQFCGEFERMTGKRPMIYTGLSYWREFGSTDPRWAEYPLWLCDITGEPDSLAPWGTNWTFHQFTFKLDGPRYGAESLDLDGDWYNGDLAKMMATYNLQPLDEQSPFIEFDGIYMRAVRFVNVRAAPTTASTDIGDVRQGEIVGPIVGIGGGKTGAWAHLADGRWVCVADMYGNVYLVEV